MIPSEGERAGCVEDSVGAAGLDSLPSMDFRLKEQQKFQIITCYLDDILVKQKENAKASLMYSCM